MARAKTSSTRRHPRATAKRKQSLLAGPMSEVVYIFAREGERGGGYWWLVLACGHAVARKRHVVKSWSAQVHLLFRPIEEKLAPKRVQCHYCGHGAEKLDPWITVKAFGGEIP
jgi:hypothetical protein